MLLYRTYPRQQVSGNTSGEFEPMRMAWDRYMRGGSRDCRQRATISGRRSDPLCLFSPSPVTSLPTLCLIDNGLFQPGSTHKQGEDFTKYITVGRCLSPHLPQRVSLNTSSTFLLLLLSSAVLVGPLAKDQSNTVLVEEAGTGPMDIILFTVPSTFATVEGNCHCTVFLHFH